MSGNAAAGRTGLVLAAGYGSRHALGDETVLKPLLQVGGRALIFRVMEGLERAGCSRVVVVLGFGEDRIRRYFEEFYDGKAEVVFVSNPRFDLHNGMSVLAARDELPPTFVLAMADHVFDESVMTLVTRHSALDDGATLVVDFKLDSILDIDDATKVFVDGGRILRIGKALEDFNAVDCGLFLAGDSLIQALEDVSRPTGNASLSDGIQELAETGRMEALDLGSGRWQDVDTAETLLAAEQLLATVAHPPRVPRA
jgi:1L-myo-inositol 1-phosphate cytidylyltransferase